MCNCDEALKITNLSKYSVLLVVVCSELNLAVLPAVSPRASEVVWAGEEATVLRPGPGGLSGRPLLPCHRWGALNLYALITLNVNSPCGINFNPGPLHVDCSPCNVAYTYMFGSYRIYYEGVMHVYTLLLRGDLMVLIVTFALQWYCTAHKEAIPPAQQGDRDGNAPFRSHDVLACDPWFAELQDRAD